jgi:dihydrofolate synthase/folylpolyglutamate synthase
VGLGGRLDATNVVEADVSVIASISLDHTQILGDTLTAIAREKADIIKYGRPCVSAPQSAEALAVIWETAATRHAPLHIVDGSGAAWEHSPEGRWDLLLDGERLDDLQLSLRGGFQRINAGLAATALAALSRTSPPLSRPITLEAIRSGLEAAEWPGRFEVGATSPLVLLDGAHNVESAIRLREALHEEYPGRRPIYVLGIARDKDVEGIVKALCGPAGADLAPAPGLVVATASNNPRAADPDVIAELVEGLGVPPGTASTVATALVRAQAAAGVGDMVVATGSLHVVAEAREALGLAESSGEDAFNPWMTR